MSDEYALPPIGASIQELIRHYEATERRLVHLNANIPEKSSDILRIVTYNVHWWCNSDLTENVDGILESIKNCNADIVVLQVVTDNESFIVFILSYLLDCP
jgi:hypothetical protein